MSLATRIESNRNGGWVDIQVVQEGLNGQTNTVELDNIKRKKNEVLRQGVVVGLGRQSRHAYRHAVTTPISNPASVASFKQEREM